MSIKDDINMARKYTRDDYLNNLHNVHQITAVDLGDVEGVITDAKGNKLEWRYENSILFFRIQVEGIDILKCELCRNKKLSKAFPSNSDICKMCQAELEFEEALRKKQEVCREEREEQDDQQDEEAHRG